MTMEMKKVRFENRDSIQRETFDCGYFDVDIEWLFGRFRIDMYGGWNFEEEVPEHGFGTSFYKDHRDPYYGGLDQAFKAAFVNIDESNEDSKLKETAKSALARAYSAFRMEHNKML